MLTKLDIDVSSNMVNTNKASYTTSNLFIALGTNLEINSGVIRLSNVSIKDRVRHLLRESYGEYVDDIKFIAYIEGNTEVYTSIHDDDCDDNYSVMDFVTLCEKLDTVRYNNFEIEVIG